MVNNVPGSAPGLLRKGSCQILFPNPTGPLSVKLDSAAIQEGGDHCYCKYR